MIEGMMRPPYDRSSKDQEYPRNQIPMTPQLYDFDPTTPSYDYSPMIEYSMYPQNFGNFSLNMMPPASAMSQLTSTMGAMNLSGPPSPPSNKLVLEPGLLNPQRRMPAPIQQNTEKANLYKTELCKKWMTTGTCRYGTKCQFAHGHDELRTLVRHPLYKTTKCKSFQATGTCRYGSRCRFIHDESDMELSAVPRIPVRNAYGEMSGMSESGYDVSGSVRFSNDVDVEDTLNVSNSPGVSSDEELAQVRQRIAMSKRVPSAPANLDLMGIDPPETLALGLGPSESYDYNYDDSNQVKETVIQRLRQKQMMRKNLTFHGLDEIGSMPSQNDLPIAPEPFKVSSQYRNMSASVSDFQSRKNWSFHDKDELFAPELDAKALPVAQSSLPEKKSILRSNLSSSRLHKLSMDSDGLKVAEKKAEKNVELNFLRSISNPELADLN